MFPERLIPQVDQALASLRNNAIWDATAEELSTSDERRQARTRLGRLVAFSHLRDFLSSPVIEFDNPTAAEKEAVRLLDSLFDDDDHVIVDIDWERDEHPWEGIYDPRVQGTRFTFIGSGSHRYAYYDSITQKVYKRLRDFGDPLLEEAFWAEERASLRNFKQHEAEALETVDIRYAETSFYTTPRRTYMIQEHLPQTVEWLEEDVQIMTKEQEWYLERSATKKSGLTHDICAGNLGKDANGTLVIIDLLHVTYDAYLHMIV